MDNGSEQARLIVYGHDYCGLARMLAEASAIRGFQSERRP
jgi:hypothetical protein